MNLRNLSYKFVKFADVKTIIDSIRLNFKRQALQKNALFRRKVNLIVAHV